ncbi:MAG: deoxynucleoside kinase [Polyangiaceae bacterium]
MRTPRIIAVAGNMGAGKSTLVRWLENQFDMVPFFEPNDENPYLADFYGDMKRWSLHSQLFFLIRRFEIHKSMDARAASPRALDEPLRHIVQDRTIYEDAEVFAAHLHRAGHIDDRDWAMYQDLYRTLTREIRPPDLMIYLRCPLKTLVKRIAQRGRAFEQKIPRAYLKSLEELYEEWFEGYNASEAIVVETDRIDYIEHLFDRMEMVETIRKYVG